MLLTDWATEVRSQGTLGSCTGWGSTANRELLVSREVLSPLFAYMGAKFLDGRPDTQGSWQHFCFEFFERYGHLHEADLPYTDRPADLSVEPYLDRASALRTDGFSDILLDPDDRAMQPTLIKAVVAGQLNGDLGPQPVSISIALYESWDSAATSVYGLVVVPDVIVERLLGGHAMCVLGYMDADAEDNPYGIDYFIVKNSWGKGWAAENPTGLPGYCLIPAAYFTHTKLLWECLVCLAEPSPVPRPGAGWLDLLRVPWSARQVAVPTAVACG